MCQSLHVAVNNSRLNCCFVHFSGYRRGPRELCRPQTKSVEIYIKCYYKFITGQIELTLGLQKLLQTSGVISVNFWGCQ